jgi:hypothetical protein
VKLRIFGQKNWAKCKVVYGSDVWQNDGDEAKFHVKPAMEHGGESVIFRVTQTPKEREGAA